MEALQLLLPTGLSALAWHRGSWVACLPPATPGRPCTCLSCAPARLPPTLPPSPPTALLRTQRLLRAQPSSLGAQVQGTLSTRVSSPVRLPDQDPPGLGFRRGRGNLDTGAAPSAHPGQPQQWGWAAQGRLQAVPSAAPTLPPPRASLFLGGQCPSR
ncbi:unnamed protein product [Rangifer tarandus platyrhynchus]|uniref:Uncharacterized protein n=1 Tax=Rangifer tarandus platyrhynchus TaxID=3082113 RepID=A0AC59YJL5_RANTA